MDVVVNELEHIYRQQWVAHSPTRCREFLARVQEPSQAAELLVRMLCVDLELCRTANRGSTMSQADDDDDRVRPNVALFLVQFPELRDNTIGIERLVMLEYALRVQHDGERPNIDSYVEMCPSTRLMKNLEEAQARLLELNYSVYGEPCENKVVEKSQSTIPQGSIKDSFVAPSVPLTLGRFLLIRYIGRGGMGFVYSAIDLRSTAQVAIKMMRRGDGWSVFRFIEEFHWLSQLNHPNLVRLFDAYAEGDARYFSMEFVDGKDIRHWYREIKSQFSDHLSTLTQSLAQLASAIHFIHQQGVIHRDIKCSNAMITPRGRTVLLDLGLAIREADQHDVERPMEGDAMPGTFVYMSPEAYNNRRLTAASDWYSFGVTMFELLAGEVPQGDGKPAEQEKRHIREFDYQPDRLHSQLEHVPSPLAKLCVELLNPEASKRPKGEIVLRSLGIEAEPRELFGSNCFGREAEISQLNQAASNCLNSPNSKALVTISGEAGMGKSHLLNCWLRGEPCQVFRTILVRGQRQDHTPYRLWNQIVQELVRLWGLSPIQIEPILKRRATAIAASFPQFSQLDSSAVVPCSDTEPSNRILSSIQALLETICDLSQLAPMCIAIDNAQWSDPSSMNSFARLLTSEFSFHGQIVLVCDDMSKLGLDASAIGQDVHDFHVTLHALSRETSLAMLQDWCQHSSLKLSPSELSRLASLSKGSPFLLRELFRSAIDQQLITSDFKTDELDLNRIVHRRFTRIPRQAEIALQYLAISDQPLLFQQMISTCRLSPRELQASLNVLAHQGWIRVYEQFTETTAEIASESFRDVVLESMPQDRLERRHFRLAKIMSAEIDPPWSRIAFHYEKAADYRLAAICHIEAARDALKKGAFREALFFIEKGIHPDAQRSQAEAQRIELMRAECLSGLSQYEFAANCYAQLAESESDSQLATELRFCAGEEKLRAGMLTEGVRLLRGGLTRISASTGQPSSYVKLRNSLSAWWLSASSPSPLRNSLPRPTSPRKAPLVEFNQRLLSTVLPLWYLNHEQASSMIARLSAVFATHGSLDQRLHSQLLTGLLLAQYGKTYAESTTLRFTNARKQVITSGSLSVRCANDILQMIWCFHRGAIRKMHHHANKAQRSATPLQSWEQAFIAWNQLNYYWLDGRLQEFAKQVERLRQHNVRASCSTFELWSQSFPANLIALIENDPDRSETALQQFGRHVEFDTMTQPAFYCWLSQVQVELYRNNLDFADKAIQQRKKWLRHSGLLGLTGFAFLAITTQVNLHLLRLRENQSDKQIAGVARQLISQLRQLPSRAYQSVGVAYQLVLDAMQYGNADFSQWQPTKEKLRQSGLSLYAQALQWHESLYAGDSSSNISQYMQAEGVSAPERLMNLILPLP